MPHLDRGLSTHNTIWLEQHHAG